MTPLERAAQAIHDTLPCNSGEDPPDVDLLVPVVRAVLTAIREPSEAMDRAAAECESSYVGDVFAAMIDAALAEGE